MAASFTTGYYIQLGKSVERINDLGDTVTELEAANTRLTIQNKYALQYNKSARKRIEDIQARLNRNIKLIESAKTEIGTIETGLKGAEDSISAAIETVRRIRKIIQIFAEAEKSL